MRITERELLMEYLINQLTAFEEEERELLTRVRYVKCDSLDCLELMIAKEKTILFREFASHVLQLLKISAPEEEKKK